MKRGIIAFAATAVLVAIVIAPVSHAGDAMPVPALGDTGTDYEALLNEAGRTGKGEYAGILRIYILEPDARQQGSGHSSIYNGFLDFALIEAITQRNE